MVPYRYSFIADPAKYPRVSCYHRCWTNPEDEIGGICGVSSKFRRELRRRRSYRNQSTKRRGTVPRRTGELQLIPFDGAKYLNIPGSCSPPSGATLTMPGQTTSLTLTQTTSLTMTVSTTDEHA